MDLSYSIDIRDVCGDEPETLHTSRSDWEAYAWDVYVECPHCGDTWTADISYDNDYTECPSCGSRYIVEGD